MQFYIYFIQDFYESLRRRQKKFINVEPFEGLFTQGMVCHETYKDKSNNWFFPDEVETNDGKKYFLKNDPSLEIKVGPSRLCPNQKNTIDPQIMINNYGADAVRLFILSIIHLKKIFNGLIRE